MALFARYLNVGQEVHLNRLVAIATAGLTASALHIERKAPRLVATNLGFWEPDEERTDVGKDASIGCRVRTWSASNGTLVHIHHLVNELHTLNGIIGHGASERAIEMM